METGRMKEKDIWFEDEKGKIKLSHKKLAITIIEENKIITMGTEKLTMYYFNKRIWCDGAEVFIGGKCQELTDGAIKNNDVREVIGHIQRTTWVDRSVFENIDENLICVDNGIIDMRNGEIKPHDPEQYFLSYIDIKHNKESKCPKIIKFLGEILYEEDIPLIQEFMGFCLNRR